MHPDHVPPQGIRRVPEWVLAAITYAALFVLVSGVGVLAGLLILGWLS